MSDELSFLDATAQADLARRGQVLPVELVDAAIARIERLDLDLNAVITPLFDQAHARAAAPALSDGPFRGVPLLLKDFLCQTAGDPYYEGMRFLRDLDWRAEADTHLATRFRAAGFIVLGKTNLTGLAALATSRSTGARTACRSASNVSPTTVGRMCRSRSRRNSKRPGRGQIAARLFDSRSIPNANASAYSTSPIWRAMTYLQISLVPSPMVRILASR